MTGRKWRIFFQDNLWKLRYPGGFAHHSDHSWITEKAQELWENIYREREDNGASS